MNDVEVNLQSNNPDIDNLVKTILKQDKKYDFKDMEVTCTDSDFDKESFKNILVTSINELNKMLQIEDCNFKNKLEQLTDKKESI